MVLLGGATREGALSSRAVVLVEGESDRIALRTLARRWGHDLDDPTGPATVVAMGGITNLRTHVERLAAENGGRRLVGLYDAGEEVVVRRHLAAAAGAFGDPSDHGFLRCERDLEDELIRALGMHAVEAVVADAGEARSLALLAQMPAQRGWSRVQLLRRFLTSQSGRKARYAELLTAALPDDRVPVPLRAVLAEVGVEAS